MFYVDFAGTCVYDAQAGSCWLNVFCVCLFVCKEVVCELLIGFGVFGYVGWCEVYSVVVCLLL